MAIGLLGTKLGMTQIFDDETGLAIPVTIMKVGPCTITQIKTSDTDGYNAVQIGYSEVKEKALAKPELGHLKKAGALPLRHLKEYRVDDTQPYKLGETVNADLFNAGDLVDITGTSMGRGFAGYQKRHNFKRGNMTHGSKSHRLPGSTGAGTTPGRVYPGKKMAGQYGASQVTTRHLKVVQVDAECSLLLIKGAVPGKPGGLLNIIPTKIVGK
ncbi:MAG: LSU ribosomal protein L3P [Candidatus Atelocyanobacterium thalassa isolate SIO64986]|uniref:Large ribosomal subunit protein uL3 n=1 Tax=Candidatus Atelocyanobacterium thalassa isolate SIO64986 TaxID=1527444 RepID=A0A086CHM2_9CHRO|nr:MAG: LSU ribosomal protein L3P [Candidatus Atelocyanobacterium thalassa isolate SIO64986]